MCDEEVRGLTPFGSPVGVCGRIQSGTAFERARRRNAPTWETRRSKSPVRPALSVTRKLMEDGQIQGLADRAIDERAGTQ